MRLLFYMYRAKTNSNGLAPIYCRIKLPHCKDAEVATGIFLKNIPDGEPPSQWDNEKKVVFNHPEAEEYNEILCKLKMDLKFIKESLDRNNEVVTPDSIKRMYQKAGKPSVTLLNAAVSHLCERLEGKRDPKTKQTKKLQPKSEKKLYVCLSNLDAYLSERKKCNLTCSELNVQLIADYEKWLSKRKKTDGNLYSGGDCAKMLEFLLSVAEYIYLQGHTSHDIGRDYKVKRPSPGKPIYLKQEELDLLEQYEFSSQRIRHAVDVFLFLCGTGMAHIEYWRFDSAIHMLPENNGFEWIMIDRQKTKDFEKICYIPVVPLTQRILQKYNNVLPRFGNTDESSTFMINQLIKQAAAIVGIQKDLSSHVGRKTAANLWRWLGIEDTIIKDCLGNTLEILRRHYLDDTEVNQKRIGDAFRKAYE